MKKIFLLLIFLAISLSTYSQNNIYVSHGIYIGMPKREFLRKSAKINIFFEHDFYIGSGVWSADVLRIEKDKSIFKNGRLVTLVLSSNPDYHDPVGMNAHNPEWSRTDYSLKRILKALVKNYSRKLLITGKRHQYGGDMSDFYDLYFYIRYKK